MGLLDPVYAGVNTVIAGAGSVAGGAVSSGKSCHFLRPFNSRKTHFPNRHLSSSRPILTPSSSIVGTGISATGRGIGDSVTNVGTSWGDYAKDTGNYIMDATKGSGSRVGTRSNPLGLERSQNAAINYGMNSAGTYKPAPRSRPQLPAKKPSTPSTARSVGAGTGAAKKPTTGAAAAKKPATGGAGAAAKKPTANGAGVPKKPAGGPSKPPATSGVTSGKTRVSDASRPKPKTKQ